MTVTMLNFRTIAQDKISKAKIKEYANNHNIPILHACWATPEGKGFKLERINTKALQIN